MLALTGLPIPLIYGWYVMSTDEKTEVLEFMGDIAYREIEE